MTGTLLDMARRLDSAGSACVWSCQTAAQGSQVSYLTAKGSKRAGQKLQGFWLSLGSITYPVFYWSSKSEASPCPKRGDEKVVSSRWHGSLGSQLWRLASTGNCAPLLPCFTHTKFLCSYSESVTFRPFHPTIINKKEKRQFTVIHLVGCVAGWKACP